MSSVTLEDLTTRFRGPAKRTGNRTMVFCSAHDDVTRQNLALSYGAHGRLLVHCHAGCEPETVLEKVGLKLKDLFPASTSGAATQHHQGPRHIAATYDYTDGAGDLLYQVVRFEPKAFAQRRPHGPFGWTWSLGDVRRVLYRLPHLVEQPLVVWCEGEKDADRLASLGLASTTSAMGAGAWKPEYAEHLAALGVRELVILPDNDEPGRTYAAVVATAARAQGLDVRIVQLPGLPAKGDVSDWLDRGHSRQDLEALIASTPYHEPPAVELPPRGEPIPVELTDLLDRHYPEEAGLVAGGIAVRGGLIVGAGDPKLGKSTLFKNLLIRRHRGEPWLGFATTPGRSLLANAEIPEPELQKRLRLLLTDGARPPKDSIHVLTDRRIKLDRPEGLAKMRQHLDRVRPDLLVIDPLARFFSGDENSARDMGALVAALDVLIQEYGLTIILVHHTGGKGATDRIGGHRLRGSSALFGAADTVMLLERADDGFKLSFELRHGQEPAPLYLTRTPTMWFVPAGPPEELLAVAWLVHSGPLRPTQLMEAIKKDRSVKDRTAWKLLERTKKADLIALDADGYYCTTAQYAALRPCSEPTT